MNKLDVSVIIPLYNEEENVPLLHQQLKSALEGMDRTYEIIYIDDGSRDHSYERLCQVSAHDSTVSIIRFRRNYGQTSAISAGIDHSRGNVIIPIDADLQNDPADIPRLLEKIDEGFDVVSGWRKKRQDAAIRRKLPSKIANGLISRVTGVRLHDYGCTLKAYRREVLVPTRLYGEMHRFIPVHASWNGASITEIPVNHRPRQYGKSKYTIMRTFRVILDLVTVKFLGDYVTKPHYAFGYIGLLMMLFSAIVEAIAVVQRFVPPYVHLNNNPLLLLGAVVFVIAVQVILMGLLAELVMRTYYESQSKPTYLIREVQSNAPRKSALSEVREAAFEDARWYQTSPFSSMYTPRGRQLTSMSGE